ncbi:propionyl-CoA synthetase [Falsigemmobacter intermedius]|uniref:Propionyl-CoA synthetase n=1 Tax=Falsigemmobacter intermedius TaxID=1553448 RepID=A0A444MBL1_9RHOB|nr:propionyl-CoA synthetase [Falsigemmobacter intermedius]RWY41120.1 propionyl-CoA synthetase [Falsigemmobacter intermedius]
MSYHETYAACAADPDGWWMREAGALDWVKKPTKALFDDNAPLYEWFADGELNACWNAVDRHVLGGRADQTAIIWDSAVTGQVQKITYRDLQERTARLAGALRARGVAKGDRVLIYMPMIPETMVAMLACARIGAVHSVVFGGFAAPELATRIEDATPKAILAASCGIEPGRIVRYKPLLDAALKQSKHQPDLCVIFQRPEETAPLTEGRDMDWHAFQKDAPLADCLPVAGNHPAYILYTSGTTGQPKGVVRHTAGHLVAVNWSMKNIYGMKPGEVFWTASDLGWVVGHSFICYGPLVHGNTTVLFEGKPVGTPDAGTYWRVVQDHKVAALFTAPTAFRAIRRDDPDGALIAKYDLSSLRTLFLAGERADPDTIHWAQDKLQRPVVDHWWQTETGWPIAANPVGLGALPVKPGSPSVPMPGYQIEVLDDQGRPLPANELGAITIRLPLPPGTLPTLWQAEARFRKSYLEAFPGYYETGDAGYMDEDGYVYIMARTDDVINVAGHRLSTGAMEEVLLSHPDVAECAVIGAADALKGQTPIGFLCLNRGTTRPEAEIIADCVALMRDKIGPVADFRKAVVIERLPKTRSGKILRATMLKIADGAAVKPPATIDDPAILDEIRMALGRIGYPLAGPSA